MAHYFITGTDTGVGKTFVTCALLYTLKAQGTASIGMKPIAAGGEMTPEGLNNADVEALHLASGVKLQREDLNCYLLSEPIAPHIAAANEDIDIDLDVIRQRFDQLAELADVVLVEGVGGFIVPLADSINTADLAQDLDLPVILVVGMRLGCLNHALLTQEAILARGLTLALGRQSNRSAHGGIRRQYRSAGRTHSRAIARCDRMAAAAGCGIDFPRFALATLVLEINCHLF